MLLLHDSRFWILGPEKRKHALEAMEAATKIHIPGLVNVYRSLWKDPPFLRSKSTISTGPFSIAFSMFTRG